MNPIQLIAKLMGNTSGTQTSEFKLLAGYLPILGIIMLALSIFLPPGKLTPQQVDGLFWGGLAMLGFGPAAYGASRGLAKSGTTDGPYDGVPVVPAPPAPVNSPPSNDTEAAKNLANL